MAEKTVNDVFAQLTEIKTMVKDVPLIKTAVDRMGIAFDELDQEVSSLKKRCQQLEEEKESLRKGLDRLEGFSRRSNVVLYNVEEEEGENWSRSEKKVLDIFQRFLKLQFEYYSIERAHRIGGKGSNPRPIVVKFNNYKDKLKVLSRSKYLKGTKIGVAEDYTEEVRKIRVQLKEHLIAARREGRHAVLRFDKLIIEGRSYTLDQLSNKRDGRTLFDNIPAFRVGEPVSSNMQLIDCDNVLPNHKSSSQEDIPRSPSYGGCGRGKERSTTGAGNGRNAWFDRSKKMPVEPEDDPAASRGNTVAKDVRRGAGAAGEGAVVGAESNGQQATGMRRWLEGGTTTRQRARERQARERVASE
jgi:hypothetical protein